MLTAGPKRDDTVLTAGLREYDVIGIDEGQFFPDLVAWCEQMANSGKIVLVAALDGTFQVYWQ